MNNSSVNKAAAVGYAGDRHDSDDTLSITATKAAQLEGSYVEFVIRKC
jgi:hypothetical protein